jgi:hypothetical protein
MSDSTRQLVLSTPQSAVTYARGAVFHPVSASVMSFGVCVGIGYAGFAGALVASVVVLTVALWSTRWRWVRREIERQAVIRRKQKRDADRLQKVRTAGPARQQQFCELRDLVTEIERVDPAEAERFELQPLLDQFVTLAVVHQRYLASLRFASTNDLAALTTHSARRRDIIARRKAHREQSMRQIELLADDLEALDELVRLIAQRVAAPALHSDLDRELERRLWELDEVQAALDQLSA